MASMIRSASRIILLGLLLPKWVGAPDNDRLSERHMSWYFWSVLCEEELKKADGTFKNCFDSVMSEYGKKECAESAEKLRVCYATFEHFECSKLDVRNEVRIMARREKLISEKILCDENFVMWSHCLNNISVEVLSDCRMMPDMTLVEICMAAEPMNQCIVETIDRKCYKNEREATKSYFEMLTGNVVCGARKWAASFRPVVIVAILPLFWCLRNRIEPRILFSD